MLHITIIAVGQLKERFWREACDEYLKRLSSYVRITVKEIADLDPAKHGGIDHALEGEGEAILKVIPANSYVVLLDIMGKQLSSESMAQRIEAFGLEGTNEIVFVIGGSCGVSRAVKERAQARWSFGPITLPHNLARVVLLEQLYRSFKILRGEPYHK